MAEVKQILRGSEAVLQEFDWGTLTWYAGRQTGNSAAMTVGRCLIRPGCENPRHRHPNCEEILHLLTGQIAHDIEGEMYAMSPGDTITIRAGLAHNARNTGPEDAVMMVVFSSADRQMQRE